MATKLPLVPRLFPSCFPDQARD